MKHDLFNHQEDKLQSVEIDLNEIGVWIDPIGKSGLQPIFYRKAIIRWQIGRAEFVKNYPARKNLL